MKTSIVTAVILGLISFAVGAAETRGAKAIFVDVTSGVQVQGNVPGSEARARSQNRSRSNRPAKREATAAVPQASGLMIYLELLSPSGQRSRVTPDRIFHSGERILMHVTSSMDGDIAVYQRNPDGSATMLFPDPRVNNGSAFIAKGVDTVLPSPGAWFRFDDQIGTEHLTIVLKPHRSAETPPAIRVASYDQLQQAGGSKGLMLETENSGPEQAMYVMRPVGSGHAEDIVVSVALNHR